METPDFFLLLDCKRLWCGRYASKCPPSTFSHRFSFLLSSVAVCSEDFIFMICFPERWAGVVLCDVTIQSAQRYKVCVQVARSPQSLRLFNNAPTLSNINFNGFQMNRRTKAKGSRVHDIIFFKFMISFFQNMQSASGSHIESMCPWLSTFKA